MIAFSNDYMMVLNLLNLQSNQVKRTPQDCMNKLIIWNLNPLVVSRMQ